MPHSADLPPDLKGHSIDTAHPLFKSFEADAVARGMSQENFSAALAAYARGATGKSAAATPAPAPTPTPAPAAPRDFATMSTREQFAYALSTPSKRE
jgi:hypothetical protein